MSQDQVQQQIDDTKRIEVWRFYQKKTSIFKELPFYNIVKELKFNNITYYISFAQKWIKWSFFNTQCFLVISKDQHNNCHIGYIEEVIPREFPFAAGTPIMLIKTQLKYLSHNTVTVVDDKLSIPFYNHLEPKQETIQFKFTEPSVINQWINLISDLNNNQQENKENDLKMKMNKCLEELEQKDKILNHFEEKIRELTQKLTYEQRQILDVLNKKNTIQKQHQDLKEIYKATLKLNMCLEKKCEQFDKKLLQSGRKCNSLSAQLQHWKQNYQENQLKFLKKLKNMSDKIQESQNKYNIQTKQNLAQNELILKQTMKIQSLNQSLSARKNQIQMLYQKIKQLENICKDKLQESIGHCQTIQKLKSQLSEKTIISLFSGIIEDADIKKYLIDEIESLTQRQILKTKHLYCFDSSNKVNFHHFIDDHPNIVLVIKTRKGKLIAAYTQFPFNPQTISIGKPSSIISLSEKMSFPLIAGKKAITYDDYYLIFGNSEIRIKSMELLLFSNFGLATGFYSSYGRKVSTLIGEETNQVEIQTYEVFSLEFAK